MKELTPLLGALLTSAIWDFYGENKFGFLLLHLRETLFPVSF
jgi:hypothetical protein